MQAKLQSIMKDSQMYNIHGKCHSEPTANITWHQKDAKHSQESNSVQG